jgi:hypothetical protein
MALLRPASCFRAYGLGHRLAGPAAAHVITADLFARRAVHARPAASARLFCGTCRVADRGWHRGAADRGLAAEIHFGGRTPAAVGGAEQWRPRDLPPLHKCDRPRPPSLRSD